MVKAMTKAEFDALTPFEKGYAVYMASNRDDQPNIPKTYEPAPADLDEYKRGEMAGVVEAQDNP